MRINQYISLNAHYSRKEIDRLIKLEKITINHHICHYRDLVAPSDLVQINGKTIENTGQPIYIMVNKPVGITCTALKTVDSNLIDYINHSHYIFPVGRLDKASDVITCRRES
jgi:23S rRNA pseudouridine2604 synthase